MKLSLPCLLSSFALAGLLTWLLCWHPLSWSGPTHPGRLILQIASKGTTRMSVRLDEGHGIDDNRLSDLTTDLPEGSAPHNITIPLPPQRLRVLEIAFTSTPAVVIAGAQFVLPDHAPLDITAQLHSGGATLSSRMESGVVFQADPRSIAQSVPPPPTVIVEWHPEHPLDLPAGDEPSTLSVISSFVLLAALSIVLQSVVARAQASPLFNRIYNRYLHISAAAQRRPILSLAAVGLCAAAVSSYPVVFCQKSFVAPDTYPYLLYTGSPTLPGVPKELVQNAKGSDVAATMVYNVPNSALEYDAIFRDHEFPLWNRYVSTGLPLFSQGQSMLGNPLHFLAIAANGASWAWDLKFLIAKALFCFGIGLCLWSLTHRLSVSALLGASSAWIGFFAYRFNHPAFFSLCFAPWVLLPWLISLRGAPSRSPADPSLNSHRPILVAMLGLLLADWCELTSGTAKEACMILIFMNAAGLLIVASHPADGLFRFRTLGIMIGASLCFFLLSAPHWLPFLDALKHGLSWYDAPLVYQLSPGFLIGLFDDIFSQDFTPLEAHTHPSANFLVLLGFLWLIAGGCRKDKHPAALGLLYVSILLVAFVFGVIPPAWIKATPFLGNIYHIQNTFAVPLLILLLLLSGIGLSECLVQIGTPQWWPTYRRMLIGLACLLALYFGFTQASPPPPLPSPESEPPWHSYFFLGYSFVLLSAFLLFPCALCWTRASYRVAGILTLGVCLFFLHFRHCMYVRTRFDGYVMTPRAAADLSAPSPALERIRRTSDEPYRTTGFELTLCPDYNALARLEGISNLDAFSNRYMSALIRSAHLPNSAYARIFLPEKGISTFKPFLDFLNLRYYLRDPKPGLTPVSELTHVATDDLEIYESRDAWPRAFFTDQLRHYQTPEEFISLVKDGDGHPFAAVQSDSPSSEQSTVSERTIVPATHYRHTTNVTEFTVEAPGPGVIVLGEAFEEDNFSVTANGTSAPYFRVNHAFKGVKVDHAGSYRVRFAYRPHLLTPSLWLSAAGAILTLLLSAWIIRRPIPSNFMHSGK